MFRAPAQAGEIDLKLTTSDGSSQVSVVNGAAANVAAVDSSGNLSFTSALKPNGQAGLSGEILQSNGRGAPPLWIPPTPVPTTLLSATSTWTAAQAYGGQVTVSSNLVVNNGGVISGDGSGLFNLNPASVSAGNFPANVVASSIAVGAYGAITGIGDQGQALNMNGNLINNVWWPAANTDAATKAYVDVATGAVSAVLNTTVATATGTVSADMKAYVDNATGTVSATLQSYVDVATTTAGAAMKAYVSAATGTVSPGMLSSSNTWSAQQTFLNQVTVSTSLVLSGPFLANGSSGSAGQVLLSQGGASSPTILGIVA